MTRPARAALAVPRRCETCLLRYRLSSFIFAGARRTGDRRPAAGPAGQNDSRASCPARGSILGPREEPRSSSSRRSSSPARPSVPPGPSRGASIRSAIRARHRVNNTYRRCHGARIYACAVPRIERRRGLVEKEEIPRARLRDKKKRWNGLRGGGCGPGRGRRLPRGRGRTRERGEGCSAATKGAGSDRDGRGREKKREGPGLRGGCSRWGSFGTGCEFRNHSVVAHRLCSRGWTERAAGMRMNRLRDDPLPREGALSAPLTGLTINVWVVSMQPFSIVPIHRGENPRGMGNRRWSVNI